MEFGEPLHIYLLICLALFIAFLFGSLWVSTSADAE